MSKIASSYLPQSHLTPSLGVPPFEFRDEPDQKLVFRLSAVEEIMTLAVIVLMQCQKVTDWWIDGHLYYSNTGVALLAVLPHW